MRFEQVLDAARARPRAGPEFASECRPPVPEMEMTPAEAKLALIAAGVSVVAVVALFVAYGAPFWMSTTVAVVLWYVVKFRLARNKRLRATWRRDAAIVPAALVMANDKLFAPGEDKCLPGCVVVSFDPRFARDPEALAAVASRCFELKDRPAGSVPKEVEWARERLTSEKPLYRRVLLDETWAGAPDVWLVSGLRFHRSDLPNGYVDRRIWPCLVHPTLIEEATAVLPAAAWWRPEADAAMLPL